MKTKSKSTQSAPSKRLKRPRGRPFQPIAIRRSIQHSISLTEGELAYFKKMAKRQDTSISEILLRPWREEKKEGKA